MTPRRRASRSDDGPGKPGRKAKGARVERDASLGGMYVLRDTVDGRRIVKRTGHHDGKQAREFLALYLAEKSKLIPSRSAWDCKLRDIIDTALSAKGIDRITAGRLTRVLGDLRVSQLDRAASLDYAEVRSKEQASLNRADDGTPSSTTISLELSKLRSVVNDHCKSHGIQAPKVYVTHPGDGTDTWLRATEINRLIGLADGRVWDEKKREWAIDAITGAPLLQDAANLKRWLPMRRLLRLAIWTCSRVTTMRMARWDRNADDPYIDVRNGIFQRSGDREARTKKGRPPVRMAPKLMTMARAWEAEDAARGCPYVIAKADGSRLGEQATQRLIREMATAAGIGKDVTMHVVRHSGAVWMMEAGIEPEQVAEYMGITVKVLLENYDHYDPTFSQLAADALDRG